MSSQVSIYAIVEMNRRAETSTLKVRSELARIGSISGVLKVVRQGIYLQMQYRNQVALVDPQEALSVLHKIPRDTDETEVWRLLMEHDRSPVKESTPPPLIVALVAISFVLAILVFLNSY